MAYSDYGGYAYRNGEHILTRSDAVISKDGIQSTPGQWPGWSIPKGRDGMSFHVVLGDSDVLLGLYKQTTVIPFINGEPADAGEDRWHTSPTDDADFKFSIEIGGHKVEVARTITDNYYQFVKMTQADGTVWTGFSGYGVGAGLEDCGYGYSTGLCAEVLSMVFPASGPKPA